uniref:Uncharacterized protein n=1 Tax=Anguilla anguilla TaxID=7936 RepID=A0A0E9TWI6_ANGAN
MATSGESNGVYLVLFFCGGLIVSSFIHSFIHSFNPAA